MIGMKRNISTKKKTILLSFSYCTTLCLQWEPEIIAIAVLYLACKLSKFEITDWTTKKENNKQKWWEQFVEGLTKDIIEGLFIGFKWLEKRMFCFRYLSSTS